MIHESAQFSIRIPSQLKNKLDKIAKEKGIKFSLLIREILENWFFCEEAKLSMKDRMSLQALAELLYMLRGVTEQINPALKDGAKQYAKDAIDTLIKNNTFAE